MPISGGRTTDINNEMEQADFWYHEFVKNVQRSAGEDGGHFDGSSYFATHMQILLFHFWAWSTATNEDNFSNSPYFCKVGEWVYTMQRFTENNVDYMVNQGDSWYGADRAAMTALVFLNSMKLCASQFSMGVVNKIYPNGIQNQLWTGSYGYMNTYYLLFKPETFPSAINPANAPLAKRFGGLEQVVWRTGYNQNDTFFFYKHNDKMGGHDHHDAGHFEIAKFGRGLAIDSGAYEGGDRSDNKHWQNYYRRTIAHNLVTIFNPNEDFKDVVNDGGQKYYYTTDLRRYPKYNNELFEGSVYDRGGIKRYEEASDYNYLFGEVTPAYSNKCANFTRQLVYLTPDYFVIYDRVKSSDPTFKKRWLLHFQNEPNISGSVIGTDAMNGRTDYDGNLVVEDNGQGRLFIKSLLPESRIISKRGGEGFQWWTGYEGYGAYNAPPYALSRSECKSPNEIGAWRIEVQPSTPSTDDIFLHVLQTADTSVSNMFATERIDSTANNMTGAKISTLSATQVVMFSQTETKETDGLNEPITYEVSGQGASKHLIVDLKPNTQFTITNTNLDTGVRVSQETKTSSSQGTLYFETTLGSNHRISITPGGQVIKGDVNGDGLVNVVDVQLAVNQFLGVLPQTQEADLNGDGVVNVIDVQGLVNIILSLAT